MIVCIGTNYGVQIIDISTHLFFVPLESLAKLSAFELSGQCVLDFGQNWLVVSIFFNFHPNLGKIPF